MIQVPLGPITIGAVGPYVYFTYITNGSSKGRIGLTIIRAIEINGGFTEIINLFH